MYRLHRIMVPDGNPRDEQTAEPHTCGWLWRGRTIMPDDSAWGQIKRDMANWRYHNRTGRSGKGRLALAIFLLCGLAFQLLFYLWK